MEKRGIKKERNTKSSTRDTDNYSKTKTESNYGSRSSEGSTTEDEVEFEGWIEFVSKKDSKQKSDKERNARKSESKLGDVLKKSSQTKLNRSSSGNNNSRTSNGTTNGNKKMSKEKENDSINNRGEGKTRKTNAIHAQIHAQVHTSVPTSLQNTTTLQGHINTVDGAQVPLLAQLQGIGQNPIKLSFTGQIPVTTDITTPVITSAPSVIPTAAPLQIQMQIPAHEAVQQTVQQTVQHTSPAPANVTTGVLQQPQETVVHNMSNQVQHLQHVQQPIHQVQVQQPMQEIQQTQQPVQQIHQIQQPIQQIHQIQQPIQQIHQIQQPIQQIHQIQQPIQHIHQVQQPVQQIHQVQHHIQTPVQVQHIQQPVQQIHHIQQQIQHPVQHQVQVVNGHNGSCVSNGANTVVMDPMASMIVNNEQNQPPVYIRQPPTVVVAKQQGPPIFINPPPANVILENPAPQPIYINNPRPNIIMKNCSSMHSPNNDIISVQQNNGNIAVGSEPPQVIMHRAGGTGENVSMMTSGNVNVIDNNNNTNKNIYVINRNANGTGTFVHNDFIQPGNVIDAKAQVASNIFMTDMGNTQALHFPKRVQIAPQPQSCMRNACSYLNMPIGFPNDPNNVTGHVYDMGFIHNAHQMDYPQEIQFSQPQQFPPPTMTPMMNSFPAVQMHQHPQIMQTHELNAPHMFYDNGFRSHGNDSMMNDGSMHRPAFMPMVSTCMPPLTQPISQMMNGGEGCCPVPMTMRNSRSPSIRQTPQYNMQRMNSIPSGCTMPNTGYPRKNSNFNKNGMNMGARKVEITAKPVMNRLPSGVSFR